MQGTPYALVAEENCLCPEGLGRLEVQGPGHAGHAKEVQSPRIDHGLRGQPFNRDPKDQPSFRLGPRRGIEHLGLGPRHKWTTIGKNRGIRSPW